MPGSDVAEWVTSNLGWTPDATQRRVLNSKTRRGILNCTRQWGKSTVAAAMALYAALMHPMCDVLVVSPTLRQSALLVRIVRRYVRFLGGTPKKDPDSEVSVLLSNHSRIVGLPSDAGNIRGFSAPQLILVDEAAWMRDEVYQAVRPMLATNDGALWLLSTPYGQNGFFYNAWTSPRQTWEKYQVTAADCPRIRKDYLEEEREALGAEQYAQEYCCEFVQRKDDAWDMTAVQGRVSTALAPLVLPASKW